MKISNHKEWSKLCDEQVKALEGLKQLFPERAIYISSIIQSWSEIKNDINNVKTR